MEIKQFVVVTDDPEFCLGTTLLYIDTRNIGGLSGRAETCLLDYQPGKVQDKLGRVKIPFCVNRTAQKKVLLLSCVDIC